MYEQLNLPPSVVGLVLYGASLRVLVGVELDEATRVLHTPDGA